MSLYDKVYWQFYPCIDNKVVYLQRNICGFHLTEETINKRYGLSVSEIDYSSDSDIYQWCDIMNNSYDDCFYDIQKAKKFLSTHPIFENNKTVIFYQGGIPCASVSCGGKRKTECWG